MAHYTDWLPSTRTGQLTMAKNWVTLLKTKAAGWNVPANAAGDLQKQADEAEKALAAAQNEDTRTPVANAHCKTAFEALAAAMRDLKKRSFYVPPLLPEDLVALGLNPPAASHAPAGAPTAQVTVETFLKGRHELGLKMIYVTGGPHDAANKGYRVWYRLTAPGEAPPAGPGDLHSSFFTKRKKDLIEFAFEDSGKTAWFAVQVENNGKKGPWGPLVSALIP